MDKKTEKIIRIGNDILELLAEKSSRKEYLDAIVELIRKLSGCRCVGIRVLNEDKKIPYESYMGFSKKFWKSENWLSIKHDQCACIRIITGKPEPQDKQVMTSYGSFHCTNTVKFVNRLSEEENSRFRGVCVKTGFKSVSIIPIHYKNKIIGAIHLADEKENKVPLKTVKFIESLTFFIGEGINKFNLTDKIQQKQKELNDAKRLSDIGTLAATVAHELRNPLAAMQIATYNIRKKAQNPLLESHLANIEKKIYESNQTINNLLFYSRIKIPNYENTNIYNILEECMDIAEKRFYMKNVAIDKKYETLKDILIDADSIQMKELFNNILNNAYDAVSDINGKIGIKGVHDEKSIKVYIEDNGIGINKEDLNRMYEPFFTTKARGTGLGLSVCYQIVQLHNGGINIESEPGKGTTVNVSLPIRRNSLT